jgi:hypothetical protein
MSNPTTTTTATAAPKAEIKIKAPESFDGKPDHVKRWLGSVRRYLDVNDHIYNTEQKKVIFALSYMGDGPAENWVEDFTDSTTTILTSGQPKGYGSFVDFCTLVNNDFGPANPAGSAMQDLMKLRQSGSLIDYIAEFKLLAGRAGITEVNTFRQFFLGGMNTGLRRSIMSDEIPTTNSDLIRKALTKQSNFEELKNLQNLYGGGTTQKKNNQTRKPRYHDNRDPNAMEVDRMTQNEKEDCMKRGLCFRCQEKGHRANECPKPRGDDGKKNDYKGKKPVRRGAPEEETKSKIEDLDSEEEMDVGRMEADF